MENTVPIRNLLFAFDYCLKKNDDVTALKVQQIFEEHNNLQQVDGIRYKLQNHQPLTHADIHFLDKRITLTQSQLDHFKDAITKVDDATEKNILNSIKGGVLSKNKKGKKSKKSKKSKKRKTRKH